MEFVKLAEMPSSTDAVMIWTVRPRVHWTALTAYCLWHCVYTSTSSAMAQRPRDESAILRGWVTLRLNS